MRKDHIRPEAAGDRMFSLRRKPDAERKFSVLLAQALAEIDPSRFETSLDGAIACRPVVQTLNQLAGNSGRFAAVNLEALTLALAQLPESTIIENLGRNTPPIWWSWRSSWAPFDTSNARIPVWKSTKK
jgi:hypothetical protein